MKTRTSVIIAILLTILLVPVLKCGPAAAEELLIYPAAGLTSDEQVPFPGETGDALTGLINNPNDIGMVMYSKPAFSGDVMMTVMNSTPVTVTSEQREADGYRWVRVMTKEGFEGWVFATGVVDADGTPLIPPAADELRAPAGNSSGVPNSGVKNYSGNTGVSANTYSGPYSPEDPYNSSTGSTSGGEIVWIYETGKRYHSRQGCSGNRDWAVSIEEAISRGLTPCRKCY